MYINILLFPYISILLNLVALFVVNHSYYYEFFNTFDLPFAILYYVT